MTENPERVRMLSEWKKKASELWKPDAEQVVNLLSNNDAVYIDAPNGSGKTSFLCPKVAELAAGNGIGYGIVDSSSVIEFEDKTDEELLGALRKGIKGTSSANLQSILVVDEVGPLKRSTVPRLMRLARSDNYGKFVLVPAATLPEDRARQIAELDAVIKDEGLSTTIYSMASKVIPDQLSREYLELQGTPRDVTDFVTTTFPMSLAAIHLFRKRESVDDVIKFWRHNWRATRVTSEEYAEVNRKIAEYLANR